MNTRTNRITGAKPSCAAAAILGLVLALGPAGPAAGQTGQTGQTGTTSGNAAGTGQTAQTGFLNTLGTPNPQMVLSMTDYKVTAGDIYTLSYAAGSQAVEYSIPVDTSYRIRVANMGVVDVAGMTYTQLKSKVESIVTSNYPLSGVQFLLTQPAMFKIQIKGEVVQTTELNVWSMNRLSDVATTMYTTTYTSRRNVAIRSQNGQTRVYDLFKAEREGDISQNPYLRPGDIVTFSHYERQVRIDGAVERPGTYQLLAGEHLKDLIDTYGHGFTPLADPTRMEIVRMVNSSSVGGNKVALGEDDYYANFHLEDYDVITVPTITALEPVIFVEGAVTALVSGAAAAASEVAVTTTALEAATRIVVQFYDGEDYAALVRRNSGWFSAVSDIQNAYIIRNNVEIPVNLSPILYDRTYRTSIPVEANDTLIIPFRQYFVTVAGAVTAPGRFPYIPDRTWDYYVALAGGFVPDRNAFQSVEIVDLNGNKIDKSAFITPESTITANTNHFLYYFNLFAPVVTTVLSLIMTFISLQATLSK